MVTVSTPSVWVMPKGTDPAILAKLEAAIGEVVASEDYRAQLLGLGITPAFATGAEVRARIERNLPRWAEIIEGCEGRRSERGRRRRAVGRSRRAHRARICSWASASPPLAASWSGPRWTSPPGAARSAPRFVPLAASGAILAGGLAIAARPLLGLAAGPGAGKPHQFWRIVLPAVALAFAYLWLWGALGWAPATAAAAPRVLRGFRRARLARAGPGPARHHGRPLRGVLRPPGRGPPHGLAGRALAVTASPWEIFAGFGTLAADPFALLMVLAGAAFGVVIGAIPGLTTAAAIAIVLPVTFYMEPLAGLVLLYVIGKAGRYGGSIAAILFNTPGTSAAAATQIDGHPLALQGKAGKAIKVATFASACGDLFGDMLLICFAALIATWTLGLGPPEYFAIYMMAFVVIGSVVSDSVLRGLMSAAFGIAVAMVGLDFISGVPRLTFGQLNLMSGLSLVPVLIGVFVVSEVLIQAEAHAGPGRRLAIAPRPASRSDSILEMADVRMIAPVILRSSVIGSLVGMLPGLGSAVACFVAYGEEKRRARRPHLWGHGAIEGVAAPEAANNAVSGPAMIPLLTLGIPGSTVGAMMMGVFLIHGIQVGPSIFVRSGELIYALFAAGLLGILCYALIGWNLSGLVGRMIAALPPRLIYPGVLMIGFLATYTVRNSLFDVGVSVAFGLVGYAMRRYGFSPAAFVIAFILAPGAEQALRQSLRMSGDDWSIFVARPVAVVFLAIGVVALVSRTVPLRRILGRA